jgi:hypothetical protein
MKARMILETDRSWRLKLYPETRVEQDIIRAANKGSGAKVEAWSDDDTECLIITGDGTNYRGDITVPEEADDD